MKSTIDENFNQSRRADHANALEIERGFYQGHYGCYSSTQATSKHCSDHLKDPDRKGVYWYQGIWQAAPISSAGKQRSLFQGKHEKFGQGVFRWFFQRSCFLYGEREQY